MIRTCLIYLLARLLGPLTEEEADRFSKPVVPDFIPDVADAWDDEFSNVAWAEFCARQPSTLSHLNRCLNK